MTNKVKKVLGTLPQDESHLPIQSASTFLTKDESVIVNRSPLTYTTNMTTLKIPKHAISIDIAPSTDLRVSENGMVSYTIVPSGCEVEFGVAEMEDIYIQGDSVGGTLYFRFNLLV